MTDYELMGAALAEAEQAAALGEVPVGAVVARHGEVVAAAHNTRETEKNALHHAELLAIDAACKKLGGWRLWQCELFVTLEPCPMCSGAIINSRLKRVDGKEPDYMGENNEPLVLYTKKYLKSHPNINFFIYGHRHIELDLMLNASSRIVILGDWINYFSYAVFDGEHLFLENYIEGETKP